jgi:hypothetical protein
MVRTGLCRVMCVGVSLWLPSGSLAFRLSRTRLVRRRTAAMVVSRIQEAHQQYQLVKGELATCEFQALLLFRALLAR